MIRTPQDLSETPAGADLLSDVLGGMHLKGMIIFRGDFREPWAVEAPDCRQIERLLPFRPEHLVPFHVIADGACRLEMPDGRRLLLQAGDAVLLPYGVGHRMGGQARTEATPVGALLPAPPWQDIPAVEHGGSGAATRIVCGFVQCDELLFHPFLRHLPEVLHVRPDDGPGDAWLASTIRQTAQEACRPEPGSRSMLRRLTEVMFVEILRKHMRALSGEAVGWFAAVNDPVAGAALKLLHAQPLRDWSVDDLAHAAGTSKTVLTDRFNHFFDQPPIQYLTQWRLQLAAQLIKDGDLPVKTVADRSGYASEASFSRAFKRRFGAAPAQWRRRQHAA